MLASDLPHEGESKTCSARATAPGSAVEGQEHTLPVTRGDAGAAIGNSQDCLRSGGPHIDLDRRHAVPLRIVDEIAYHPTQQRWVTKHDDRGACDGALLVSGSLLGRKRKQINLLMPIDTLTGLQPARKQDLLDQTIELRDVEFQLLLASGVCSPLEQLDGKPDTR